MHLAPLWLRRGAGLHVLVSICSLALLAATASAQFVMMPDSNAANNRIVLFDPFNGALVNSNYFALAAGTPIHAMQVGGEVWVSEQVGDRVSRWSLTGASLGAVTGTMDNIRGMEIADNTVYVCNDGTANGAPGEALRMFDTSGTSLGFFAAPFSSPFGILDHQGNLLVSSDEANNDVHRYKYDGTDDGLFHNSTSLNFTEQMDHDPTGAVLVAAFSSNIVATLNPNTGAIITSFAASGARGVYQLGNGNVLWSNSAGAHVYDVVAGTSTQVYAGGGRYFDDLVIPEPGSALALVAAGTMLTTRRNVRGRQPLAKLR